MNESLHDIQTIVDTLKDALLSRLGEEVELIFQYGSHIRGNTHHYSDIDISYVPVHEQTWECITVMVGETLVDLYPMHWSKLERMADFLDVSSTVLLNNRVVYQRDQAVADRFQALAERLKTALQPETRSEMLHRAMEIFSSGAKEYYLLVVQADADHQLACLQHTQAILRTVFHCLAVCNQACIDTRKIEQVLALPKLPAGFESTVRRILATSKPTGLLTEVDKLLHATRQMLLDEQGSLRSETTFPDAFEAAYPELKRDLQGVMAACERQDMFSLRNSLLSLLREMSLGVSQVMNGVQYSGFNSLGDYEQNLAALGFPPLLPLANAGDFEGLKRQCLAFDQHLREFLVEQSVKLNTFATLGDLQEYLRTGLEVANEG